MSHEYSVTSNSGSKRIGTKGTPEKEITVKSIRIKRKREIGIFVYKDGEIVCRKNARYLVYAHLRAIDGYNF
jgi:hypothetical protein